MRTGILLVAIGSLLCFSGFSGCKREKKPATGDGGLQVDERTVDGRSYLVISQRPPRLFLRIDRPKQDDPDVSLCVAGTYTGPDDKVEGTVLLDGRVISTREKAWEGLLILKDGGASIEKRRGAIDLAALQEKGASLLQGHLLVHDGKAEPIRPSPKLRRRAIMKDVADNVAIVESKRDVELGVFASDLPTLGARAAINLDMGSWSEGWYRDASGKVQKLGHDVSATDKQSNWLTLRR